MKKLRLGLIGAGERGAECYAPYILKYPTEAEFVCVAEPLEERRERFGARHNISEQMRFADWREMLAAEPRLDGAIIATQDREHYEPAMACIDQGIHILLEKPMAETAEKSAELVAAARKKGILLMVCHVLRHAPFYKAMKEYIDQGAIGEVKTIHHIENIGYWHFAHSYVRGNWRNTKETTPMIVAKCSHDTDILNYLTGGKRCRRLSSFGSLSYFTRANMPAGAAAKCMDGCPHNHTCMYSAYHYLDNRKYRDNFRDIILRTDDPEAFLNHLKDSRYSDCVYQCDNDAVDHQVVTLEYEDGITATLQASAFSMEITRQTKVMGTSGEIEGCMEENCFEIREFATGNVSRVQLHTSDSLHGGGDESIMRNYLEALRDPTANAEQFGAEQSLQGHAMAFAAEYSRLHQGAVVEFDQ